MIDISTLPLLKGKKALVTGIANDQSIAWGCAKAFKGSRSRSEPCRRPSSSSTPAARRRSAHTVGLGIY